MSNRGITAAIVMTKDSETCAYLRIEASNGQTYARVTDKFRKRPPEVQFGTWRTDSRDPDVPCNLRSMPKAVRLLFQGNQNPMAA